MRDSNRNGVPCDESGGLEGTVAALRRGGIAVYPTETFYGLGADVVQDAALERLRKLKGRAAHKPTSVLVSNRGMLLLVAEPPSRQASALMDRFWPGPLTLVLKALPSVSPQLTGSGGTIGVRWSSHPLAAALVAALGRPVASPSANPGGAEPPVTLAAARAYFGTAVDAYLDGGTLRGGAGSTVVDPGPPLQILRPGVIPEDHVVAALRGIG